MFRSNCLCDQEVTELIEDYCVFYAISVKIHEGYKLCHKLRVHAFPFIGIFSKLNGKTTVHAKIDGYIDSLQFLDELTEAKEDFQRALQASRVVNSSAPTFMYVNVAQ